MEISIIFKLFVAFLKIKKTGANLVIYYSKENTQISIS